VSVLILGHLGVIGSAQKRAFTAAGFPVVGYDPAEGLDYPDLAGVEFAVGCLPTHALPDGRCNLEAVFSAVSRLPEDIPLLLRSTVPPGTMDVIASRRSGLTAYAPEFMYENPTGPWQESTDVPYVLLGGDFDAVTFFAPHLLAVYGSGKITTTTMLTAELAKYTINLYWATKVTFVNEMAAVTAAFGGDWEYVRSCWLADPRVNESYTRMDGFPPGFGGRCWPKDLSALISHCHAGSLHSPQFLQSVQEANARFTKGEQ
jgi:UDPglucose 6-dehydrogenase